MNSINPIAEKVLRLLLDQGPDAANRFVNNDLLPTAERAQQVADAAKADVASAQSLIALASRMVGHVGVAVERDEALPLKVRKAVLDEPEDRRDAVLAAARKAAGKADGIATTDAVIAELYEGGVILDGKRPGTAIGNVLFRTGGWERIGEGMYRIKHEAPHAQ